MPKSVTSEYGVVTYVYNTRKGAKGRPAVRYTGKLGYDGLLYDRLLAMTYDMLGPSHMQIKYVSYVYEGFCIFS